MRRNRPQERKKLPDHQYNSELVTKFVNCVMVDGKKSIAEGIVYHAIDMLSQKGDLIKSADSEGGEGSTGSGKVGLKVFEAAIEKVKPSVEVKSRRVGGATFQVPCPVHPKRATALAMRWLIESARKRNEKSMKIRLGSELIDALQGRGAAVKKLDDVARMAAANKAFAHFAGK